MSGEWTNQEFAEGMFLMRFLEWMRSESAPTPVTDEERSVLVNKWISAEGKRREVTALVVGERL